MNNESFYINLALYQYVTKDMYPKDLACYDDLVSAPDVMSNGGSAIVGPLGDYVAEPVWGKEEIIIADLDMKEIAYSQFDFDSVGHYSRPDIFKLVVNKQKQEPQSG